FSARALEQDRALVTDSPESRDLISCGPTFPGHELQIVDPLTLRLCGDSQVGEIWLAGPHVAAGYWNRPQESRHTFLAVSPDLPDGQYLRTGDLGFLCQGELFVTGRLKEMMIVRGRNHYPQDIEAT